MPRAGVASAFDAGWDWIDPQRDGDPAAMAEAWDDQPYYDWSQTGDFSPRSRVRRAEPRALRPVPDARPRRRPVHTPRPVAAATPRPVAASRPVAAPRPVAAAVPRPVAAAAPSPVVAAAAAPRPAAAARVPAPVVPLEPIAETPAAGRRTVTITGRGAERHLSATPRRPSPRSYERAGFRPDRIAMWAVLLGVLMILAATTSAHAALLHP